MKERILVTGGAGYIGSVLCPLLLQRGYSVTALDNLYYKQPSLLSCFSHPHFRFVLGDACDEALLSKEIPQADVLLPLAAIVGAPACDRVPQLARAVNLEAIQLLLKHASTGQKIVYPNTNSCYGIGPQGTLCTEETPMNPISHYARLKVEGEKLLLTDARATVLRLATVFGLSPRMRLDLLINDFTFRACQDRCLVLFEEKFMRNYIHVKDIANAFLFAIEHYDQMRGQAFNAGHSGSNLNKRELCTLIGQFIPNLYIHSAKIGEDPDKRDYLVSSAKLEKLGWQAEISLETGIRELVAAYPMLRMNSLKNV